MNNTTNNTEHNKSPIFILVSYEEQGQPVLGLLTGENNAKKKIVLNEEGQQVELIAARIATLGPLTNDFENISKHLKAIKAKAVQFSCDLEKLWSACSTEPKEYSLAELLSRINLDPSLINLAGLRFKLITNPTYFQRIDENFCPRTSKEIEQRKEEQATRRKEEQTYTEIVQAIKNKLLDADFKFSPQQISNIRPLLCLAAQNLSLPADHKKAAIAILKKAKQVTGLELNGAYERQAYSLLHKLGIINADTNLCLVRYDYDLPHAKEAELAAEKIKQDLAKLLERQELTDLTALECLTIDDITTKDMDDALSIEKTASGYRLGIHISNVAEFVEPNSLLDQTAAQRTSSVYMPDITAHMLPETLACDALSLLPDQIRPTLSVLIDLDHDYNILSSKIIPAVIKVKEQLDYCYVDQVLHEEIIHSSNILTLLYEVACTLEAKRMEQGGFKVPKKDATIRINSANQLVLEEVDENSPAHSLIGEMMILANQTIAEFAVKNNLALIFRSQSLPDRGQFQEDAHLPPGLAQDYAMRFGLKPSQTGLVARPHSTLGLKAYAQVTSPIRRYGDLCNQRQLLSFLRNGQSFYSNSELYKILEHLEQGQAAAGKSQREGKRFWFLRYLQQQKKSQPELWATVLRNDGKLPLIQLEELYLTTLCKLQKKYKPGDRVRLKICRLSPAFGELELTEA